MDFGIPDNDSYKQQCLKIPVSMLPGHPIANQWNIVCKFPQQAIVIMQ